MAIKGLKRNHPKAVLIYKYEYKGCFISRSLFDNNWFVHAAYDYVKIPRGIKAKTLKDICKKIDKALRQA
jgi:hypothetical protein